MAAMLVWHTWPHCSNMSYTTHNELCTRKRGTFKTRHVEMRTLSLSHFTLSLLSLFYCKMLLEQRRDRQSSDKLTIITVLDIVTVQHGGIIPVS